MSLEEIYLNGAIKQIAAELASRFVFKDVRSKASFFAKAPPTLTCVEIRRDSQTACSSIPVAILPNVGAVAAKIGKRHFLFQVFVSPETVPGGCYVTSPVSGLKVKQMRVVTSKIVLCPLRERAFGKGRLRQEFSWSEATGALGPLVRCVRQRGAEACLLLHRFDLNAFKLWDSP